MVTFNADAARNLAFMLMECADFLQPPFDSQPESDESNEESESLFGPYESEDPDDEEEE
jgi:hypothetical protein